jgi:hypothetical protein
MIPGDGVVNRLNGKRTLITDGTNWYRPGDRQALGFQKALMFSSLAADG